MNGALSYQCQELVTITQTQTKGLSDAQRVRIRATSTDGSHVHDRKQLEAPVPGSWTKHYRHIQPQAKPQKGKTQALGKCSHKYHEHLQLCASPKTQGSPARAAKQRQFRGSRKRKQDQDKHQRLSVSSALGGYQLLEVKKHYEPNACRSQHNQEKHYNAEILQVNVRGISNRREPSDSTISVSRIGHSRTHNRSANLTKFLHRPCQNQCKHSQEQSTDKRRQRKCQYTLLTGTKHTEVAPDTQAPQQQQQCIHRHQGATP